MPDRIVGHQASDEPAPDLSARGTKRARRGQSFGCALEIIGTVSLTLFTFLVIQNLVAQPFQVKGGSMERTFADGDYVLVDRLTPRWSPYARGQVVVFHPPETVTDHTEPFIKRVIGIGGDKLSVRDGQVFVNGAALDEPYLFRDATGATEPTDAGAQSDWVVPDGDLFVMGDNRLASEDSRVFGSIPISSVIGRGVLRYWPPSDLGIIATPSYAKDPPP